MSLLQPTHIKFGWRKKNDFTFSSFLPHELLVTYPKNKINLCKYIDLKRTPATGRGGPKGSRKVKAPDFLDFRHYEDGRSSGLRTGRLHPQEKSLILIFRG